MNLNWAKQILFSVFIFLVFFTALELLLRGFTTGHIYIFESNPHYVDSNGWFRLKANTDTWWYGLRYEVNSDGFRMRRDIEMKRGVRLVGLGDSITEGMGVRDSDATWPFLLEKLAVEHGFSNVESA